MSVRFLLVGWMILDLAACNPATESPLAPEQAAAPKVPVQPGPPPAGNNNPPTVVITAPANGASFTVGSTVQLSADFTDLDVNDTHTCSVDWQLAARPGIVTESGGKGTCTASNLYSAPGTYQVMVSIIDQMGATASATIGITVVLAAPPPPPPPPPSPTPGTGSVGGAGRFGVGVGAGAGAVAGFEGKAATVWFELEARISKEGHRLRGGVGVDIPRARFRFVSTEVTKLAVKGTRAELSGVGRLNGRRRVSFAISAVDGHQGERGTGTDRVRIKIWDEQGVLFDTNPGLPMSGDPTVVPRPGRIVVKP